MTPYSAAPATVRAAGARRAAGPQRTRILAAATHLVCECDGRVPTVAQIAARAGVSIRTFNLLFGDPLASVVAAFEDAVTLASERARLAAAAPDEKWFEQTCGALEALLEVADDHPELARLCVLYAPRAGEPLAGLCAEQTRTLARALARSAPRGSPNGTHPWIASAVTSSALEVVATRLRAGHLTLSPLRGELMGTIARAYVGDEAARDELEKARPRY